MTAPVKQYIAQRGSLAPFDPPLCSTEVAVVLASDYDRLEQECWRLREERDSFQRVGIRAMEELDNMKRSWGLLHAENEKLRGQVEAMQADKASIDLLNQYIVTAEHPATGKTAICADNGTLRDCMEAALQAKP